MYVQFIKGKILEHEQLVGEHFDLNHMMIIFKFCDFSTFTKLRTRKMSAILASIFEIILVFNI